MATAQRGTPLCLKAWLQRHPPDKHACGHSCQKMGDAQLYRPDAVDDGTLSTLV